MTNSYRDFSVSQIDGVNFEGTLAVSKFKHSIHLLKRYVSIVNNTVLNKLATCQLLKKLYEKILIIRTFLELRNFVSWVEFKFNTHKPKLSFYYNFAYFLLKFIMILVLTFLLLLYANQFCHCVGCITRSMIVPSFQNVHLQTHANCSVSTLSLSEVTLDSSQL